MAKESQLCWAPQLHDDSATVYWTTPERSQASGPVVPTVTLALMLLCGGATVLGLLTAIAYVAFVQ